MYEIHGKRECPFAWRVRLAAREKGVPFEWIPFDVRSPDARALHHNAERRSPLLWEAGFTLEESLVIAQYIDESVEGRPLLPADPKERARARSMLARLVPELEAAPGHADDRDAEAARAHRGQRALDAALGDGRAWLGGELPLLPDLMIWPFLCLQERDGAPIPAELARARSYWKRAKELSSFVATRP
jgi:glutathione S-transferase